ncbi:hypothetical protein CWO91_01805 [Bradyrhizobium genosp. SA-3]|nr:hypothetical protein CWO91_01805 [Bradyrhizobium genosp. SA-3]
MRFAATLSDGLLGSGAGNCKLLFARHILPAFWEQCSKYLWTSCIRPDTIFMTPVCRNIRLYDGLRGRYRGLFGDLWGLGKEPD